MIERPVEVRLFAMEYLVARLCAVAFNSLTESEYRELIAGFREAILADAPISNPRHEAALSVVDAVTALMESARSVSALHALDG